MSAIIGEMEIRLRADIARLQRDMDSARRVVGDATAGMSRAADAAKAALAGIGAGIGLSQIIQMSDAYAKFTAQLRLASTSAREYAAAYGDVKRIATAAQQDLQATGMLYARIANGTRELGTTQKQVAAITETVNMALKVSGATAAEAASAQLQLSQAFASGTLRGEEFNAVNEAAPRLMLALADGIGVPVGALKKMAEAGEITSKIMADVLPNALLKLREEAKEVQTIAGAFTVLKNNVMEFVGMQANASGAVSVLTGAIGMLASNLGLLAGGIATLMAAKLGTWMAGIVTSTYASIVANRALMSSHLATANALVAETGAEVALTTARMVELRASVLAATGAAQLAIATQGLIPMQARATAASAAHTAALAAQTTAMGAASVAGGLMRGALAFLGGPLGAVITLLGIGATAWAVWGNKGAEAEKQVVDTLADEIDGYLENLNKQIEKLKERNELAGKGMTTTANPVSDSDQKREKIMAEINRIGKQTDIDISIRTELLKQWGGKLNQLTIDTEAFAVAQQKNKDLVFDKKEAEWLGKNGTAAQKMAHELAELQKEFGRVTPAMEAWVKAKYADKGAATAINQEATAYQSLVTSIGEKIAANKLELSGHDKLTDAQKMTIKLDEAIASGKNKLTPKHIAEARALIATVAAQDANIDAQKRAAERSDEMNKIQSAYAEQMGKSVDAANKEAMANEELVRTFGMTKTAIEQLEIARMEEEIVKLRGIDMTDDEIAKLELLIDAKKRSTDAVGQVEALQKQKDMWESIEKTAHDTFISIFDSGKSAFDRLKDALKNGLLDMLYQMTIKKWIFNISASVTGGGVAGVAQAGTVGGSSGSDATGYLGTAATAKSMYDSISSGFASIGTSVTSGIDSASSYFGASSGSYGPTASGGNIASSGFSEGAGMAASYAAGIAAGVYGGRAISGGYSAVGSGSGNTAVNVGTAIGAIWGPIGAAIGGAIGGLVNRAFGRKEKEFGDTSISGTLGADSLVGGESATPWTQKGGWFRSDRSGIEKAALDVGLQNDLVKGFSAMRSSVTDLASAMGISSSALDGFSKDMSITFTKDTETNKKALTDFFNNLGDEMAMRLVPGLASLTKAEESASAALQRLAVDYAFVDVALAAIGDTFGAVGVGSIAARERLIELSGGLESFGKSTAYFAQNFLTEAERLAPVAATVSVALADMGLSGVTTRDQFKDVVLGLDLTTESGATTYAGLMKIQESFALLHPAVDQAAIDVKNLADAVEIGNQRRDLEIQIMTLAGDTAGALSATRAIELAKMDESLRPLKARIFALEDEASALEKLRTSASGLLGAADAAFAVLQRVVNAEKTKVTEAHQVAMKALQQRIDKETAAIAKHKALADAINSTLNQMRTDALGTGARADAQAQVRAALAIVRAGGALPGADTLKGALSVLTKDSTGMFATMEDYLRDQYRTLNDLSDLGSLADDALSVEEEMLKALTDQKKLAEQVYVDEIKRLDNILTDAQKELDVLKGMDTTLLTISGALQAFLASLLNANANPMVAATKTINSTYQSALGRAPEAAGLQYWQDAAAGGMSSAQIASLIANSAEAKAQSLYQSVFGRTGDAAGIDYWTKAIGSGLSVSDAEAMFKQSDEYRGKLRGFAVGTNFIPHDMPAMVHQGERIIPAADNRELMARLSNPAANNAELVAEVRRLTAIVEKFSQNSSAENIAGVKHLQTIADIQEKQEAIGLPPERVDA
jgi:tape measure domain-containing protein